MLFPIIPSDSIIAVWRLKVPKNVQVGWLSADGSITDDKIAAVGFYSKDASSANAKFYSNPHNAEMFTWPTGK